MIKMCLLTVTVSPHKLPLAYELINLLGEDNFRYIATCDLERDRVALGWGEQEKRSWILFESLPADRAEVRNWLLSADVLISGNRDLAVFRQRAATGKLTIYTSERWFKPWIGTWRLLQPRYFAMARALVNLLKQKRIHYLPMGKYAAQDMALAAKIVAPLQLHKCLFKQYQWGYFVAPSRRKVVLSYDGRRPMRILWFGRFIGWKRTNLLLEAAVILRDKYGAKINVVVIGTGPCKRDLERLTQKYMLNEIVEFKTPVPIDRIREEIRAVDVGVVTSNAMEGWGVAVNEIMAEGRCVIASDGVGASITMVKDGENGLLFESGSAVSLAAQLYKVYSDSELLCRMAANGSAALENLWSPRVAAQRLLKWCQKTLAGETPDVYEDGPFCTEW